MTKTKSTNGTRKPPSSNQPGNETKKPDGFALPNIIEVSKDNWTQQGFNENSALKVKDSGEAGYDFFVNIDNIHLLSELKSAKSSEIKAIQAKYKFGLVLIGLALLNDNTKVQKPDEDEEGENIFSTIENLTRAISPVIIPMIDTLGALELQDLVSAMPEEQ